MKNLSTLTLLVLFLFQHSGFSQNNMEWVLVEDNTLPTGTCMEASDCSGTDALLCYALIYTPNFISPSTTLLFTSYTIFFRIDCAPDNMHSVSVNESCIMTDNSTETQACPAIEQRFSSSGNSGSTMVTKGNSYTIHTVCFSVPLDETLTAEIREPPAQNVQSNANLGTGANAVTEDLDVADLVIDASTVCAVLPVELLSFEGKQENDIVLLEWATATEFENLKFEIFKSIDGREWIEIGELPGSIASSEIKHYQFQDRNPLKGENYYLLKQVDMDGQINHSKIITVQYQKDEFTSLVLFPNPANSNIHFDRLISGHIDVIDHLGRTLISKEIIDNQLNVENLKKGIYYIRFFLNNEILIRRFIKN